ncbi:GPW/gp25 family protein [Enterobacter asburiae]|jgi:phage baseplate assembly protein W|uniref:GPW/gp25 family protein n=1 Tax=Enterobacter asburiae TaxID=61645 RepID=UPI001C5B14F0|nr:GPW/gp25 family protein [Enterobacter asburiae]MBW4212443.1 GPW/gp25 family protein [Enterobacter asburiae]
MANDNAFLGTGWAFPPRFNGANHQVIMSSDIQDIEQSLTILLSTTPGERPMAPDFGCRINQFVFEELTQTVLTQLESEIRHAILFFESRINVEDIHFLPDPVSGQLLIQIDYHVITINTRSNMVYPFYLNEGTLISPQLLPLFDVWDLAK